MDNEAFYNNQQNIDQYNRECRENSPTRNLRHDRDVPDQYDIDGEPFDPSETFDDAYGVSSLDYNRMVGRGGGELNRGRSARWTEEGQHDEFAGSRDRQSARSPRQDEKYSSKYRDYGDDLDRRSRSRGYGHEEPSGRGHQRSKSRERDRVRDADRHTRDRERSRDHDRRARRDESGYGNEREDTDYRSRRRSRSRDRDRDRDRRHRDSGRDRRHRDSDRDRPRRDHDRDRGDRESSPKDIPWVPPPLPEHLRHLQVQWALTPVASNQQSSASLAVPQPPPPPVQNQFQNDGSFLEMFRQKMQQKNAGPISDDSNASEGPVPSSVGAGVATEEVSTAAAAPPTLPTNSSGAPVIARRRISKILKTGVVQKKKKEEEEDQDKEGDSWSSYMKEVQRYRANKCIENEASRPPLVK